MTESNQAGIAAGLRIDVDTFRGTRDGVPRLLNILSKHQIQATFYFSLGPDNMGRHLWRLLKPAFLIKMLKSKAASLYGWDILLRGTLWPGPNIGNAHASIIKSTAEAGHEVGLHAWDHHRWQRHVDSMSPADIHRQIKLGYDRLSEIIGQAPQTSAAAGWKCPQTAVLEKEQFHFRYNSDCRGESIFIPLVDNRKLTPQIPVTLPTYDEVIGRNNIDASNYNQFILDQIRPDCLNVYTIHAEVEGIVCAEMFDDFLQRSAQRGIAWQPLHNLLPQHTDALPTAPMQQIQLEGREGTLAHQITETAQCV